MADVWSYMRDDVLGAMRDDCADIVDISSVPRQELIDNAQNPEQKAAWAGKLAHFNEQITCYLRTDAISKYQWPESQQEYDLNPERVHDLAHLTDAEKRRWKQALYLLWQAVYVPTARSQMIERAAARLEGMLQELRGGEEGWLFRCMHLKVKGWEYDEPEFDARIREARIAVANANATSTASMPTNAQMPPPPLIGAKQSNPLTSAIPQYPPSPSFGETAGPAQRNRKASNTNGERSGKSIKKEPDHQSR